MLYDAWYSENVGPSLKRAPKPSAGFLVNFLCALVAYLLTGDERSSLSPQVLGRYIYVCYKACCHCSEKHLLENLCKH